MDTDDTQRLDNSVVKNRAKNNVETNILNKKIKLIDKQCRAEITRIQTAIKEERKFQRRLKRQATQFHKNDDVDQFVTRRMDNRKNNGLYSRNSRSRAQADSEELRHEESDNEMFVSGQRFMADDMSTPKMYFWSQDSSTKMPVMSSFYGYRLSVQRSMTEVKLLGQQMYPENRRETQSADPAMLRSISYDNLRKTKTADSRVPKFNSCFEEGVFTPTPKGGPPPTRASEIAPRTPERSFSALELKDVKSKLPRLETPGRANLTTPDNNIAVNTRPGEENLDTVMSLRTAGLATRGSLRSPSKKRVLHLKTRSEATREYQELLSHKPQPQTTKVITDLDRSYSHVPTVMEEVNRLNNNGLDRRQNGQQYTKSAFCLNMQNTISKKVFTKSALPVAFRKNHNTFLKHYRAPILEVKATKMLPVSLTLDT